MITSLLIWIGFVILGLVAAWVAANQPARRAHRPRIANALSGLTRNRSNRQTAGDPVQLAFDAIDSSTMVQRLHETETYHAYIRSPLWRKRRSAAIRRSGNRCQICGQRGRGLQVHHNTYERLGFESPEDLIVLCESCHTMVHGRMRA